MRLEIALAQLARVLAVRIAGVHRRADREARHEPPARDAVDHRHLFRDAHGRVVERERVAHHHERGVARAPREARRDQVRRRHQAVAVLVVLVHADAVEAELGGVLELVHELVVERVGEVRVEQRGVDVDPHRCVLLREILGQPRVGHQVEPQDLHC